MSLIILLGGYLQSGKDTVADYLVSKKSFKRYAFADVLKDEVSELYKIDRKLMDSGEGKSSIVTAGTSVRDVLISHGQKRRLQDIDFWVKIVVQKILKNRDKLIVISDFRFENEYTTLRKFLGRDYKIVTWRICRYDRPPLKEGSETSLDKFMFDCKVENKRNLEDLYENVCAALQN